MDNRKKRLSVALISLLYIFILLFSACFVAVEADHNCIDDNCPICCQISVCTNILKNIASSSGGAFVALTVFFTALLILCGEKHISGDTLVMLKIKLSD